MKKIILFSIALLFVGIANINAQTGNVGIGTNTPTEKLEVNGNIKDSTFSTTWTPSIAYDSNYVVIYNGNIYRHRTSSNTAVTPNLDNANWMNISSVVQASEPLTITSTGTAPTKATNTINDYIFATDDGDWVTVEFEYSHINSAGTTGGSGSYLFKLPDGYSFDTSIHPLNTQATNLNGGVEVHKLIHLSGIMQADAIYSFRNYVVPYDATHFRIVTIDVNQWYFLAPGNFTMTHAIRTQKGSFRFKKL